MVTNSDQAEAVLFGEAGAVPSEAFFCGLSSADRTFQQGNPTVAAILLPIHNVLKLTSGRLALSDSCGAHVTVPCRLPRRQLGSSSRLLTASSIAPPS